MSYDTKYNVNDQRVFYGNQPQNTPSAPYAQIYPSASTPPYPNNQQTLPPPPPYSLNSDQEKAQKEHKYREIINKYEISHFFSQKLQLLFSFKIVFIFDDSGSMNTVLNESPLNTGLFKATRWDELHYFAKISTDIANIFNSDGTDIYFLNRPMIKGVRSIDELETHFNVKPSGFTPISRVLRYVLSQNHAGVLGEKKLLVIIVTDGEPTDDGGREDILGFKQTIQMRNNNAYTTIVSCTDDDHTMMYLNNWDRTIPRLDVVDDFRKEREEILVAQGHMFRFSFGDYVVKSLIGSIDPEMDRLDEIRHQDSSSCCTIV